MKYIVCKEDELQPGQKLRVTLGSRSLCVVRTAAGGYAAVNDSCPHMGARLSNGHLTGTTLPCPVGTYEYGREGEILRCPWHRWEFDVHEGLSLFPDRRAKLRNYDVSVEEGQVIVEIE